MLTVFVGLLTIVPKEQNQANSYGLYMIIFGFTVNYSYKDDNSSQTLNTYGYFIYLWQNVFFMCFINTCTYKIILVNPLIHICEREWLRSGEQERERGSKQENIRQNQLQLWGMLSNANSLIWDSRYSQLLREMSLSGNNASDVESKGILQTNDNFSSLEITVAKFF